jgi:6,7-dimethyl-8-ribityllumazine synthase
MINNLRITEQDFSGQFSDVLIGIVISDFNETITSKLLEGCVKKLQAHAPNAQIEIVHVPGAVEIPLVLQEMAEQEFDALIALGAVVRGDTSHYDYVCEQVSRGCQQIMLEYSLPVIFGVLTTDNDEQALDRVGGKHGHKGADAALAALQMILTLERM